MSTNNFELVTIENFDINRVIIDKPTKAPINKTTGSYSKCSLHWKMSNGQMCDLYLEAPKTRSFGMAGSYKYGLEETPENLEGYQICLFCSDSDTPTDLEMKFMKNLEALEKKIADVLADNHELLPANMQDLPKNKRVKPICNHPNKKLEKGESKKVPDTTKPKRFYVKFLQRQDKSFVTKIYGRDEESLDPMTMLNQRGVITPIITIKMVYLGAKASLPVKLIEADWTPTSTTPTERLGRQRPPRGDVMTTDNVNENTDDLEEDHHEEVKVEVKAPTRTRAPARRMKAQPPQ